MQSRKKPIISLQKTTLQAFIAETDTKGLYKISDKASTAIPPSGDPHDYSSLGTYWHPREKSPCKSDPEGAKMIQEYVDVSAYLPRSCSPFILQDC